MKPLTRTDQAVRLVLDQGMSRNAAAKAVQVDPAAVSRALKRLTVEVVCPHCGHIRRELAK